MGEIRFYQSSRIYTLLVIIVKRLHWHEQSIVFNQCLMDNSTRISRLTYLPSCRTSDLTNLNFGFTVCFTRESYMIFPRRTVILCIGSQIFSLVKRQTPSKLSTTNLKSITDKMQFQFLLNRKTSIGRRLRY